MPHKHPLGWSYPAGAENDPNAPWNEKPDKCPVCEEYFDDFSGTCNGAGRDGECDCPKCQGLCMCHNADVNDHPPYERRTSYDSETNHY